MAPARIWPILTTPILSPLGKLRMGLEAMIPRRPQADDESLESFVVRRLGREAFERLIQPLIGGIYTADPSKLSMAATLPQFLEMERRFGSVVRGVRRKGAGDGRQGTGDRGQGIGDSGRETGDRGRGTGDRRQESGARYGQFLAPRQGMQQLVEAIAEKLPAGSIRLNSPIDSVVRDRNWLVNIRGAGAESFNDLIFATPATVTSRLLANIDPQLAALIGSIPHAGCSVAVLGVRREQVAHPLDGFGFVVPAIENRRILAGSMASVKFPGRAPDGKVLLRVFVGGALQPELGELPDADIRRIVLDELRELIGLAGEPEFLDIARWLGMMPQYHVGHLALVNEIERRAAAIPHLAIAGNAYRGVGIPFCIHSGEQAAERVLGRAATAAVA